VVKILWIADYLLKEHKGGAQQTNSLMIKEGRKRGHTIKEVSGGAVGDSKQRYDGIIINNITKYSEEQIKELVDTGKCIRYEHDYWVAENYPELYDKVKHTVFLSPLHLETAEKKAGRKIKNYSLCPSPIDVSLFECSDKKREPMSTLFAGHMHEVKGSNEFVNYVEQNPMFKFYIAGWGGDLPLLNRFENVEYLGELELKELVKWYQKVEYFYHRPRLEAFGRVVIEAYLSGCNLLVNNNVGAISWDWDFSNYEEVRKGVQSEDKFWKIIEDEIQTSGDME
jgi:hypothetical protein